jgi:hypothetical protein
LAAAREKALVPVIAELRQENSRLRAKIRRLEDNVARFYARGDRPSPLCIPKPVLRKIRAGLHPDNAQDPATKRRLEEAFKAFESLQIREID